MPAAVNRSKRVRSTERDGVVAARRRRRRRRRRRPRGRPTGGCRVGPAARGSGPSKRTRPFSMKTARSASVSATFTDCSTTTTVMPAGVEPAHDVAQRGDDHRREAQRQLVDQQHLGSQQQRRGERELLLLAAGQVAGELVAALGQDREQRRSPRPGPRAMRSRSARKVQRRETEVLVDGEGGEHRLAAGHQRDAGADDLLGARAAQVAVAQADRASTRAPARTSPRSSVDLPAPLVPSSATISPGRDLQLGAEEHLQPPVADVDVVRGDQRQRRSPSGADRAADGVEARRRRAAPFESSWQRPGWWCLAAGVVGGGQRLALEVHAVASGERRQHPVADPRGQAGEARTGSARAPAARRGPRRPGGSSRPGPGARACPQRR